MGKAASARIVLLQGPYVVHPTMIYSCLHLFSVAASNGVPRRFDRVFMPTSLKALEVRKSESDLQVQAVGLSNSRKTVNGYAIARTEDQRPVISMSDVKLSPLKTSKVLSKPDIGSAAQLEWRPCIDLLNPEYLILPSANERASRLLCENLTILRIIETSHRLNLVETSFNLLNKYSSWLEF